jgi:hypothetical protein
MPVGSSAGAAFSIVSARNLLIDGEQRRPVELKVGQYPGWQKLAQPVPALRLPPVRRGRQPVTNKQPAALGLHLPS